MYARNRIFVSLLGAVLLVHVFIGVAGTDNGTSMARRRKAAEKICSIMSVETFLEPTIRYTFSQKPEFMRSRLIEDALNNLDKDKLRRKLRKAYVSNYSAKTLEALVKFFKTPAGKEYLNNYAEFTAEILPIMSREVMRVYRKTTGAKNRGKAEQKGAANSGSPEAPPN